MEGTAPPTLSPGKGPTKMRGFLQTPRAAAATAAGTAAAADAKLDETAVFRALPSVIHFGGFHLKDVQRQVFHVVNISDKSQRMSIVAPTTAYFRIEYDKQGMLAPGMEQAITIEFMPTEWRYYYDCLRIVGEEENLLIPVHAYPVMNEVYFPSSLDFGTVALGSAVARDLELRCKVPIEFEYELTVEQQHPDITVTPLQGVIPANGSATIRVRYRPVKLQVARARLVLRVSQFDFEPLTCEIVGNSSPGTVMQQALEEAATTVGSRFGSGLDGSTLRKTANAPPAAAATTQRSLAAAPPQAPSEAVGAGTAAAIAKKTALLGEQTPLSPNTLARPTQFRDAGAMAMSNSIRKKARTLRRTGKPGKAATAGKEEAAQQVLGVPVASPNQRAEGVLLPNDLSGVPAANFVLTQQEGKLRLQDLAMAIDRKRERQAKQLAMQEQLRAEAEAQGAKPRTAAGVGLSVGELCREEEVCGASAALVESKARATKAVNGVDPHLMEALGVNDMVVAEAQDRKMREMVFLEDVAAIEYGERNREFQAEGDWLGEIEMTEEEKDAVMTVRVTMGAKQAASLREMERNARFSQAQGPNQDVPQRAKVLADAEVPADHTPSFKISENNSAKRRKQVLLRLRALLTTATIRRRTASRVALLWARVASVANDGPAAVRRVLERDFRKAQTSGKTKGHMDEWVGALITARGAEAVQVSPLYPFAAGHRSDTGAAASAVAGGKATGDVTLYTPVDFEEWEEFTLQDTPHAELMGYKPFPVPSAPTYQPVLEDQHTRPVVPSESLYAEASPAMDLRLAKANATVSWSIPKHLAAETPQTQFLPNSLAPLLPDPFLPAQQPIEALQETSPNYLLAADTAVPFCPAPPPLPTVSRIDINGNLLNQSQAYSALPGASSLRALLPTPAFANVWVPQRERPAVDVSLLPSAALDEAPLPMPSESIWTVPEPPQLLPAPRQEDELSDDTESDVDEDKEAPPMPSWALAESLFKDAAAAEEEEKEGGGAGGEPLPSSRDTAKARGAAAIGRDRALLELGETMAAEEYQAASWLEQRVAAAASLLKHPSHAMSFAEL